MIAHLVLPAVLRRTTKSLIIATIIVLSNGEWHSNGGLKIDSAGNLWAPTGQEGPLILSALTASAATATQTLALTIQ